MLWDMIQEESQDADADGGSMILQSFTGYDDPIIDSDNGRQCCAIGHLNTNLNEHGWEISPTMDHG